jgi:hypothetical protein
LPQHFAGVEADWLAAVRPAMPSLLTGTTLANKYQLLIILFPCLI